MDSNSKWQDVINQCEFGKGWNGIMTELLDKIEDVYKKHNLNMQDDFKILQAKQKFGELIIYYQLDIKEEINKLVQEARIKSIQTCEECGEDGKMHKVEHCRVATLCRKCAEMEDYDTSDD